MYNKKIECMRFMRKFLGFITTMLTTVFFLSPRQFYIQAQEITKIETKVSSGNEA